MINYVTLYTYCISPRVTVQVVKTSITPQLAPSDHWWEAETVPPNLAKAYLPPVGTEDGRTGPGRGRDVWQIVHVPGWALAIEAVVHWTRERVVPAASMSHLEGLSRLARPYA
jgi:hypothetical protein